MYPSGGTSFNWINMPSNASYLPRRQLVALISVVAIASILLVFTTLNGTKHIGLPSAFTKHERDGLEAILGPIDGSLEEGLTIVSPTFKRPERLPAYVDNYARGNIPSLRRIVLQWADPNSTAPADFLATLPSYPVLVIVTHPTRLPLTERFRRDENMRTEAILAVDDDTLFHPRYVEWGYQMWKKYGQGRKRMTGFFPREVDADGTYRWKPTTSYSMVLTKAAYIHLDWLDAFWSDEPKITEARNYVEEYSNCEDILMSFLYAHYTRISPLYMQATPKPFGKNTGISSKPGHSQQRTACVRKFQDIFGKDTLISSDVTMAPLGMQGVNAEPPAA